MAYGLTTTGFVIKPYQIIQQEIQAEMQSIFGTDLDVSSQSVAGQWINRQAQDFADLWELCQTLYSGYNPDTASGAALEDACSRVNVTRLPATPTKVTVILYGTVGTTITAGHIVSQTTTGNQFTLDTTVTLATSISGDLTINISSIANAYTYSITINGTPYTYLSDGTATAVEIINGLFAALGTIAGLSITLPTTTTLKIVSSDGKTAFNCTLGAKLGIVLLGCPGAYTAVIYGAVSVPLNTIVTIVNAISGLAAVNNLIQGDIGRNLETDDNLRIRRKASLTALGRATDGAISGRIVQEVSGITSCIVVSNRLDTIDSGGRPPHSFEVIVSGGTVADIGLKIWENMPSGVQSYGNTNVTILDSLGNSQVIYFSRPVNIYIWLNIILTLYSEETYPVNGDADMKDAIQTWSLTEIVAGKDVIIQRVLSPIYTIPGVSLATITLATSATPGGPPGAYSGSNLSVASNQIAVFDQARIAISHI